MESQNQVQPDLPNGTTLFRFNRVPIVTQPGFYPIPILVTGFLAWMAGRRKPDRPILARVGEGLLAMPVALFADVGHAMAHTISARLAGAPMDEILLSSEMPRTLYRNNAVPPWTHILRSLGGPIFSLACTMLSLLWRRLAPPGSVSRDLADVSLAGHSIILVGSVAPLPMVDGGIILKWILVEGGQSPERAEASVRKASLGLGAALLGLGALRGLSKKQKLVGGVLSVSGLAAIAAGKGIFH